jgi:hypothetical protein
MKSGGARDLSPMTRLPFDQALTYLNRRYCLICHLAEGGNFILCIRQCKLPTSTSLDYGNIKIGQSYAVVEAALRRNLSNTRQRPLKLPALIRHQRGFRTPQTQSSRTSR